MYAAVEATPLSVGRAVLRVDTAALTDLGVMIKNDNPNYKHFNMEHLVGAADGNCSDPKHVYGWQRLHAMYKIAPGVPPVAGHTR